MSSDGNDELDVHEYLLSQRKIQINHSPFTEAR